MTVTDLAQRIGLSAAPCHRRWRELERAGVITSTIAMKKIVDNRPLPT
ncbi:MAG TPA: winged helix-turn-helix transcriptional regulator [Kribbella sp.]|nr:winged helix-turn-helix transcriptional regulator [Kribbella sp.]